MTKKLEWVLKTTYRLQYENTQHIVHNQEVLFYPEK